MPASSMKHTSAAGALRRCGQVPDTLYCAMEVVFYKEILDHFGFPHQCELMRVSIPSTKQDAEIREAIRLFEQAKRVSNWKIAADRYEVVDASRLQR
ncbi:hypothetical protein [Paraburkholderia sp. BL10I2N1]|uniref:hypothetical protein n=1 Tax=Paraburkholderia sp. BL10I2N1 TaxID=1938796 RepID=UPI00105F75EB|nr:hypothetical protein [Paraburkholderia sp. BL10I2N1]TDN70494.1 hypothetical protein B0G77_3970 [Paraburkholderia sp. BL10I2N1]